MKKSLTGKAVIAAAVMVLALAGCTEKAPKMREEGATVEKATVPPETDAAGEEIVEETLSPEQMEMVKYNYYVELNNDIIKILDNIDYYYEVVNYEEEFSLIQDSGLTYGYRISGVNSDIVDDCLQLASMEPAYDTLDPLMKEIAEPLRDLMDAFSGVGRGGDYAANQYEKPKEYHAVIYPLTENFEALADQFVNELSVIADEMIAQEEEKMKAEGRLIIYNASRGITIAQKILTECSLQGVTDENLTELDLTNIKPLYEELAAVIDDLNAATADNEQIMKESISNSRPFDQLYERMLQALEWMIGQVESGQPIEDISLEPLGSLAHFTNTVDGCIDRYNSIFAD